MPFSLAARRGAGSVPRRKWSREELIGSGRYLVGYGTYPVGVTFAP
jgi:hypothetical protein